MRTFLLSLVASTLTLTSLIAAPQAIVFDFGGVLTGKPNREAAVNFIRDSLHMSEQEFEEINQKKHLSLKQGSTDELFWNAYAKAKGIQLAPNWHASFKEVMKEAIGVNPQMYLLVEQLKAQQLTVALLSNINERLGQLVRHVGLYEPFTPCLLSYEIGIEKPDLKAYEVLLQHLNLPAKDVVFIDDRLENVEAAKAAGIDAILFESEQELRSALKTRGVL